MKAIIFLIIAWSTAVLAVAQDQLNITIIGTTHSFSEQYQSRQDFNKVRQFIIETNPEIICIEAIPTTDTISMKEIWPNTMKRADALRDSLTHQNLCPEKNFTASKSNLSSSPEHLINGACDYANYDIWNAYYHWFQVQENGDSLGTLHRYMKNLDRSEYGLMVFPAARELGVDRFYGIDYRAGEEEFLASNSRVLKKLLFRLKWKPLGVYLKTQKRYKKAEEAGRLMEFINGLDFQESFSQLIDDIPQKLPKVEEAHFVKEYWLRRNEIMAQRLVETAEQQGAQNVLLTVGSAHVTHIRRFLEAWGHDVLTYGETLIQENK